MNWNKWIRQTHRWVSIAFTVTVIANFVAMAQGAAASRLGDLLAAAPARLAPVHRSVPVRAAVCHQVAQRATHRLNRRSDDESKHEEDRNDQGRIPISADRREDQGSGDWRGETLSRLRALIKEADPEVVEEWKWRGVPVWSHDGIVCTGETYKNVVKMTFAKGASLKDPSGLFNSSLEGNVRRAIDFHEGDKLNEKALKALIRAAVALNKSSARG